MKVLILLISLAAILVVFYALFRAITLNRKIPGGLVKESCEGVKFESNGIKYFHAQFQNDFRISYKLPRDAVIDAERKRASHVEDRFTCHLRIPLSSDPSFGRASAASLTSVSADFCPTAFLLRQSIMDLGSAL